jgi:SAM-dependent methyltransferase
MNPTPDLSAVQQGFQGDDQLLMDYFEIIARFRTTPSADKPDPLSDNKLKDIYRHKTHGKLLDIGCSVGDFLNKAKHFYDVEGLEINPVTAAIAEQSFTVHKDYLHQLIARKPAEFSKRYDIVSMHQLLYGVPDPLGLLKEIHIVLKDDGILYINTPNADSYAMQLFTGRCNHLYGYTTQNVFDQVALKNLAARSGFNVTFFRTEWLDIYYMDIIASLENPEDFIHKRNSHLPGYEKHVAMEDALQSKMNMDLASHGNYIVAVLSKC